jgi:hypothetical protein
MTPICGLKPGSAALLLAFGVASVGVAAEESVEEGMMVAATVVADLKSSRRLSQSDLWTGMYCITYPLTVVDVPLAALMLN